jgi:hypothetical protein
MPFAKEYCYVRWLNWNTGMLVARAVIIFTRQCAGRRRVTTELLPTKLPVTHSDLTVTEKHAGGGFCFVGEGESLGRLTL